MNPIVASIPWLRTLIVSLAVPVCLLAAPPAAADAIATIDRVKGSIVAIGTFERTRTPQFQFRGTGFVVGDGTLVATNAHVLPGVLDPTKLEVLGILVPSPGDERARFREAKQIAVDPGLRPRAPEAWRRQAAPRSRCAIRTASRRAR